MLIFRLPGSSGFHISGQCISVYCNLLENYPTLPYVFNQLILSSQSFFNRSYYYYSALWLTNESLGLFNFVFRRHEIILNVIMYIQSAKAYLEWEVNNRKQTNINKNK